MGTDDDNWQPPGDDPSLEWAEPWAPKQRKGAKVMAALLLGFLVLGAVSTVIGVIATRAFSHGDDTMPADGFTFPTGLGTVGDSTASTFPTTPTSALPPFTTTACDDVTPAQHGNGKQYAAAGDARLDPAKHYTATMTTTCGTMVIDLDLAHAPKSVNNFVFLAREGFYDGLTFHRVVTNFVVQGGDPRGDGAGGPGYTVQTESPSGPYALGDLAWAKTGTDPDGTAGSQFFVVTGTDGVALPTQYGRFGHITQGLDVARTLESLARDDQTPSRPLFIEKVTITES